MSLHGRDSGGNLHFFNLIYPFCEPGEVGGADLPRMFLPRKSFFNQNVFT
jgi:hypothetical protein